MKSTSSIARKINMGFWFERLLIYLVFDMLLIAVCLGMFILISEKSIPQNEIVINRSITDGNVTIYFSDEDAEPDIVLSQINFANLQYVIETNVKIHSFLLGGILQILFWPACVVLLVELIVLLVGLFGARKIRHQLRPYNELAKQAEKFSSMASDDTKFMTLENAISKMNPDTPDARIVTGNKDLQSLEIAINNLIDKMRENYKQQIRFVSDASHELRTPISVIQGYVNMLDRWGKNDESVLEESIEALKNESEHMKRLVEQLLFLARGDSGRNLLSKEWFDLANIVQEVYEESLMIDEKHKYELKVDGEVRIFGDAAMIKQSIRIFADNAAKYSKEGDTIILAAAKSDMGAYYLVQDEGVGMAESEVVHVFERFYRSDSARNSSTGGSGLGLSIAKWIVDAHNGEIQVLSRKEFGTRFKVIFNNTVVFDA